MLEILKQLFNKGSNNRVKNIKKELNFVEFLLFTAIHLFIFKMKKNRISQQQKRY